MPGSAHPVPYTESLVSTIMNSLLMQKKRLEKNHSQYNSLSLAKGTSYEQAF
jgi:hypothetical protein